MQFATNHIYCDQDHNFTASGTKKPTFYSFSINHWLQFHNCILFTRVKIHTNVQLQFHNCILFTRVKNHTNC